MLFRTQNELCCLMRMNKKEIQHAFYFQCTPWNNYAFTQWEMFTRINIKCMKREI